MLKSIQETTDKSLFLAHRKGTSREIFVQKKRFGISLLQSNSLAVVHFENTGQEGWGDGLVGKVLATKHEYLSLIPSNHIKSKVERHLLINPVLGRKDQEMSGLAGQLAKGNW